jgi:Protein of unknown function (DUF2750)
MHKAKQANVEAMGAAQRFDYFVRKVADFGQAWGLFSDGWAMAHDDAGTRVMPFWPEAEFAAVCSTGPWAGYQPRAITLDDLLVKWLPGMATDAVGVAVFPMPSDKGVIVTPDFLRDALVAEASQYD